MFRRLNQVNKFPHAQSMIYTIIVDYDDCLVQYFITDASNKKV